ILLYNALGYELPIFAHLPMILGSDKARLSKRHGATSVIAYKAEGYLPHALVNYLARLGWSHGDQEIFSMEELVKLFSFDHVGKAAGVFNPEKLLWLNAHYIKESTDSALAPLLVPFLTELGVENAGQDTRLEKIVSTLKERAKTLVEMAESAHFYFKDKVEYEEKPRNKFLKAEKLEIFKELQEKLGSLETFSVEAIETIFNELMEKTELKLGKIAQPVRVALTGGTVSPGIFETIEAMGSEMVMGRLEAAITYIESLPTE
ncbi:MAG: glutamate--tRNA ligase, partial [Proteobacteria bacterium]|nr:glutamate--tRNA ligase [Pseudomonadota bacterium]